MTRILYGQCVQASAAGLLNLCCKAHRWCSAHWDSRTYLWMLQKDFRKISLFGCLNFEINTHFPWTFLKTPQHSNGGKDSVLSFVSCLLSDWVPMLSSGNAEMTQVGSLASERLQYSRLKLITRFVGRGQVLNYMWVAGAPSGCWASTLAIAVGGKGVLIKLRPNTLRVRSSVFREEWRSLLGVFRGTNDTPSA